MPTGVPANGQPRTTTTEKVKLKVTVWAMGNAEHLQTLTAEQAAIYIEKECDVLLAGKAIKRIYDAIGIKFHTPARKAKKKKMVRREGNGGNRLRALAVMVRDGFKQAGIPFDEERMLSLCRGTGDGATMTPPV